MENLETKVLSEEIRSPEPTSGKLNKRINYKGPHVGTGVGQVLFLAKVEV